MLHKDRRMLSLNASDLRRWKIAQLTHKPWSSISWSPGYHQAVSGYHFPLLFFINTVILYNGCTERWSVPHFSTITTPLSYIRSNSSEKGAKELILFSSAVVSPIKNLQLNVQKLIIWAAQPWSNSVMWDVFYSNHRTTKKIFLYRTNKWPC